MRVAFIAGEDDRAVLAKAALAETEGHQVVIWQFGHDTWSVRRINGPVLATCLPLRSIHSLHAAWQPDQVVVSSGPQSSPRRGPTQSRFEFPGGQWTGAASDGIEVSVITPTLNAAHHLRPCLESVAAQTGVVVEHVLVDGVSTDGTANLAAGTGYPTTWMSEPDRGIAEAFNKGIQRARGRYVIFIGADDRLRPGALAHLRASLDESLDAGFVHANCGYLLGDKIVQVGRANPDYRATLPIRMAVIHPTVMVRREVFAHAGLFRTDLRFAMDHDLVLRWDRCGVAGVICPHQVIDIGFGGVSTRHVIRARQESAAVAVAHGLPIWRSKLACTVDSIRPFFRGTARRLLGRG